MKRLINYAADHPWMVLLVLGILFATLCYPTRPSPHPGHRREHARKGHAGLGLFRRDGRDLRRRRHGDRRAARSRISSIRKSWSRHVTYCAPSTVCPNVTGTSSLFDAKNLKNIDDTIYVKPYLESLPQTPTEVASIKAEAIRNPLVLGNLISADGQTIAINVFFKRPPGDADFDRVMTESIEAVRSRRCANTSRPSTRSGWARCAAT